MKNIQMSLCICFLFFAGNSVSANYTSWAVPTRFEIVQGGILISGDFGNPMPCKNADSIYYGNADTDYNVVVSMVMAAITAGKEVRFYADDCKNISFHGHEANRAKNGYGIFFR